MKIFGRNILLKKCSCSVNGAPGERLPPEVNLYVRVTNACDARCAFCSNYRNAGNPVEFNREKLLEVLDELEGKGVAINRLSFTGGEPGMARGLMEAILSDLSGMAYKHIPATLSTNGLSEDSRSLIRHPRWNRVCMSVHHYDYVRMAEVYGLPGRVEEFNFSDIPREKLSFTCNLIKGFIESPAEMVRMMLFAHAHRINVLGFVELMPVNAYCEEHRIDIDNLDLSGIEHLVKDRESKREGVCFCRNYLHSRGDDTLNVYVRTTRNPFYCESSLLYDGRNLRQGFHEDGILY